ncbi:hypothetical protein ACQPX6_18745 [Actinomycetospora sp. CA-101289]|uniref:hypothetical protein n=1 Tax=Actinomycetospora sp. CA-101289 TaxID=3239893 RepID=UPI003D96F325
MTGPKSDSSTQHEGSTARGEAAPEATSPMSDGQGEQADQEGRHVERDVEDNADLDG